MFHVSAPAAALAKGAAATGSADDPFSTLAAAQAAVRATLVKQKLQQEAARDIVVRVHAGSYFDTELVLTEDDSPVPGGHVTWRGEQGATVYGGARVAGPWRPWRGQIWQVGLPAALVDSAGRARFHMLTQGLRSCWNARTPNFGSGFLPCAGSSTVTCPAGVLPDDFDCVMTGVGTANVSSVRANALRFGFRGAFACRI